MVEEKLIIDTAVQEILELLRNQNVYNISQIQQSVQALERKFAVSMGIITAVEILGAVFAVIAVLMLLKRWKNG